MQTLSTLLSVQPPAAAAVAAIEIPHFPTIYRNRIICVAFAATVVAYSHLPVCLSFIRHRETAHFLNEE